MTAIIDRRGTTVDAIDLFCGYGGSSQGIHAAGASVRVAANHSQKAIDCHAANYPDVDHRRADLSDPDQADYLDPVDFPATTFMWASPSCKFHSQANATKIYLHGPQSQIPGLEDEFDQVAYANSERSRVTMLCPLRYAARHRPQLVVVENVVEAAKWGPNRDGATLRWWLEEWERIGYDHETLFLNSMFFPPCPQSRDRMYVVFWRRGNRRPDLDYRPTAYCTSDRCAGTIVQAVQTWKPRTRAWPIERWGKYDSQYIYVCPECSQRVEPAAWPAYTAINWANLGPTLGERSGPLAPATMERIRRGLMKFRGSPPIIIPTKSVWGTDRPVTAALTTQTSQQDKALVGHAHLASGSQNDSARHPVEALFTVVADGRHNPLVVDGMVVPLRTNGTPIDLTTEQLRTIVGGNIGHALIVKNNGSIDEAKYRASHAGEPMGAVTAHPSQAIVTEGVVVAAAGNTYDKAGEGGYVRAKSLDDTLFTQHATQAFGFAHVPFVTTLRGGGSKRSAKEVTEPVDTVTASGFHHGLTSPAMFQKLNGDPGDTVWHHVGERLNTITGRDTTALLVLPWVDQWRSDPIAVTEQLATVMSHLRHSLAVAPIDASLEPITDDDLMQVRFRMLEPDPELRRAMAFEDEYILLGNQSDKTSGLGNAVTPPVASWITERCLATLRGDAS
jgi:DNA (cytosine-5)-methyltransferase 1